MRRPGVAGAAGDSRRLRRAALATLVRLALTALAVPGAASRADAQSVLDGPMQLADGRVVVSGEVSATTSTSSAADEGWFNYASYELSTLRNLRIALAASARINDRVTLVGEVRTDNFSHVDAYALFVRVRPWRERAFDVHLGRVPPTFGAFARRPYSVDNPVVGLPLAYQYLTALRPDAVARTADDLAAMRGEGWRTTLPVGNLAPDVGLPMVNALRWDTGVQVRAAHGPLVVLGSVTTGTPSNPRVSDDNGAPQVAARVEYTPRPPLRVGLSAARGPYLADAVLRDVPEEARARRFAQRALGADVEVSRGRWLVRAEALSSWWDVPVIDAPRLPPTVRAWSVFVEGRYRLAPGWDVASRIERLAFGEIATSQGRLPWDADVDRLEIALGWSPRRGLRLKGAWQVNTRDAGDVRDSRVGALQCIVWF